MAPANYTGKSQNLPRELGCHKAVAHFAMGRQEVSDTLCLARRLRNRTRPFYNDLTRVLPHLVTATTTRLHTPLDTGHKALMPGVTTTHPGILWARTRHTMGVKGTLWWVVVRAYYGSTL